MGGFSHSLANARDLEFLTPLKMTRESLPSSIPISVTQVLETRKEPL